MERESSEESLSIRLVSYLSLIDTKRLSQDGVNGFVTKTLDEVDLELILLYGLSLHDFENGIKPPPMTPSPVEIGLVLWSWLELYFYKYDWNEMHLSCFEDFIRGKTLDMMDLELKVIFGESITEFSNSLNRLREDLIVYFSINDPEKVTLEAINPLLGWSTRHQGLDGVNQILQKRYGPGKVVKPSSERFSIFSPTTMKSSIREKYLQGQAENERLSTEAAAAASANNGTVAQYVRQGVKLMNQGEELLRNWRKQGVNEMFKDLYSQVAPTGNAFLDRLLQLDVKKTPVWQERSSKWLDTMVPQGQIWLSTALETSLLPPDVDFSWAFTDESAYPIEWVRQVDVDIPRSFPDIDYFEDPTVRESFRRVLLAVALTVPDVGYVQGMNFIVGYIMMHCKGEMETHRLMVEILTNPKYSLRHVFTEGLPGLSQICETLKTIVQAKMPNLFQHFQDIGFDDFYFSYQWITTLFTYTMPFDALVHVWDLFFERGWEGFFQVAFTLIHDNADVLRSQDFDESCVTMKSAAICPPEDCFVRARGVTFTPEQKRRIMLTCT